jgi:hypothetical protein
LGPQERHSQGGRSEGGRKKENGRVTFSKREKVKKKKKEKKRKGKKRKIKIKKIKKFEIIEAHLRQENSMDPEFQANQQSNQITDWAMRPKEALLLHHNQYGK